jgi:hypothetical protein
MTPTKQTGKDIFTAVSLDISNDAGGWAQLSPYGDFPNTGTMPDEHGRPVAIAGVQRVSRADAEALKAQFDSVWSQIKKRFSVGVPIFLGHPDHPDPSIASSYPDRRQKGVIAELQVRDAGLYCRPIFNNDGAALLQRGKKLCLSVRWGTDFIGEEGDRLVFRPVTIKSAGLVERSALPVEYLNHHAPMNREKLLALLKKLGCELANDAPAEQVDAAMDKAIGIIGEFANHDTAIAASNKKIVELTDKLKDAKSEFSNEHSARVAEQAEAAKQLTGAKTEFANERAARIADQLDAALAAGRISAADRVQWQKRLETDFSNEVANLRKLPEHLKTRTLVLDVGSRKVEISNVSDRRQFIAQAIAQRAKAEGMDPVKQYDQLFNAVLQEYPQLMNMMSGSAH